jgi:acyl phosphate:glycerol-3-phosphate acyltransferase
VSLVICLAAGYLIGGIPFGIMIARLIKGVDPRTIGSGGMGATNVSRVLGKKWGIVVLLFDAAKGYLPVIYLSPMISPEDPSLGGVVIAVAAMAGHVWTPYAGFRGGKGVATAAGAMLAIDPVALAFSLGVWVLTMIIFRYVSLASVMAAVMFPLIAWRIERDLSPVVCGSFLIACFLIYTHRNNFKRILAGSESKFF